MAYTSSLISTKLFLGNPIRYCLLAWLLMVLCHTSIAQTWINSEQACHKIANKLSSVSFQECHAKNLLISGWSVQGFPLLLKEFRPLPGKLPLGRVLLIGGIHGDEYSSVSVTFKWLQILQQHHSGLFHWIIAPLVNPDGLLRRHSHRTNAHQVDLNRNFPSLANPDSHLRYWIHKTQKNQRKYPGKKPLSEPETQWLSALVQWFQPDVIVSVHAPYGIVDFDAQPVLAPKQLGPLYLHLLGTYPGSLGRYGSEILHVPVVTIELAYAGIMPSQQDIKKIWTDLISWLKKYFYDNLKERVENKLHPS